jgi:tetratricopeptide (TPR) repeat protein
MKNSLYGILIALAAAWWTGAATMAETNPQKVIIFPFYGTPQSESLEWVGKGIAVSLSKQLRNPMVNVMDSALVAELMETMGFHSGIQPSRGSMISIAQKASADLAVMGTFEGTKKNLSVSIRVLHLEAFRLSGNIAAVGPLAALPQLENELAWQILGEIGTEKSMSRKAYYARARQIPNSAFALYIQSLDASGENDKRRMLLKALDIFSAFPEAQFQLGMHYYRKGDCKNALRYLGSSGAEEEGSMVGAFTVGTCHLQMKQLPSAIETYSRMLQNSRPYEVLNNLGIAHLRRSENLPALNALEEAHTLAPDEPAISLNLAIALQIQGNVSRARNIVEGAIKANPQNGMLHFMLGFLFRGQGEEENAEKVLQEAANLGVHTSQLLAQDPNAWLQLFPALCSENSK